MPVAREGHGHHRLGEQHAGAGHRQQDGGARAHGHRRGSAPRRRRTAAAPPRRAPPGRRWPRSAGVGSSSGATEASESAAQASITTISPARSAWAWRITSCARSGGSGSAETRGEAGRDQQAHRGGHHEALVRPVEQHARRGQRVQHQEAGGGQEGQRDQEQARVGAAQRDARGLIRQHRAEQRRGEHEPEVGGMVLPADVGGGRRQQQHEAGRRQRHGGHPRRQPGPAVGSRHEQAWPGAHRD